MRANLDMGSVMVNTGSGASQQNGLGFALGSLGSQQNGIGS
ncbi:hypothetical protein [Jongsikchunia kroppenstedtii]|nr:hypothetical protein [Jongsikchunia kroppenstedtii]